jgi:hypothetical protein
MRDLHKGIFIAENELESHSLYLGVSSDNIT